MRLRVIYTLLLVSVIFTLLSAYISHYTSEKEREKADFLLKRQQFVAHISDIMSLLKDIETGHRGYLLTGQEVFLEPRNLALTQIEDKILQLGVLTHDRTDITNLIAHKFIPQIQAKIHHSDTAVALYQIAHKQEAIAYVASAKGKTAMDSVRATAKVLTDTFQQELQEKTRALAQLYVFCNIIRATSFIGIIAITILSYLVIRRQATQNQQLIDSLEQKVTDRTREISDKNDQLNQLNEELRQSMEELQAFYDTLQIRNTGTEIALKEIQDLYENAPCGYHSIDNNGIIVKMNQTELNWLGYTRDEVIGKKRLTDLVTPYFAEGFQAELVKFKQTGIIKNAEFEMVAKDGRIIYAVLNSTAIFDQNGQFVMSRSTIFDIRERKEMEQALLTANKELLQSNEELTQMADSLSELNQKLAQTNAQLKQLNDDKNTFLGIVAHDLKNPVHAISGLADLLKLSKDNLPQEHQDYINYISSASANMSKLITKLLDINRIEQGRSAAKLEDAVVYDIVAGTVYGLNFTAAQKAIHISLSSNCQTLHFKTDKTFLAQITENLVSNAVKFSPGGSKIQVRLTKIGEKIRLEVEDNGPGISPADQEKLFMRFQKLSAKPTNGESSTGLGLSIVKDLVEAIGGNIRCESALNEGTTFIVELNKQV